MVSTILGALAFLAGFCPPLSIAAASVTTACFLLAVLWAGASGRETFRPQRTYVDLAVLAFMAAWLLASLAGMMPAKSLAKALSQTRFLTFYLLVWTGGGRYRRDALKGYLWGAGTAVAYGFFQLASAALSLETRFPAFFTLGGAAEHYMGLQVGRIHGAVHPLTYAEVILPFFLFGVAFLLEAENRRKVAAAAGWVLAAGLALLLSRSRGPWLGAALGAGALFLFHPRRTRLLGPLALLSALVLLNPALRGRAGSLSEVRKDESASDRLALWNNAWQIIRRHPWLGVGPGRLKEAIDAHRSEPGFLPNPHGRDGDAHNQFLHHWAERGLPGLAALLWLMGAPVLAAARAVKARGGVSPPGWVRWGLLAAFLSFPVVNLTERVLDDGEPAMVFWLSASLLVFKAGDDGEDGSPVPGRSGGAPRR